MAKYYIEAKGIETAIKNMYAIGHSPHIELKEAVVKTFMLYVSKLKPYPHRPGSKYVRTYRLQSAWLTGLIKSKYNLSMAGLKFVAKMQNDAKDPDKKRGSPYYASYVQGPSNLAGNKGGQAWMHQGIWEPINHMMFHADSDVKQIWEDAIEDLVKRYG